MHQFIQGSNEAFLDLAHQAQQACVVFESQALPAGSHPATGHVGFQKNPDNTASLFVERGASCPGAGANAQRWLREGELHFASFEALRDWIRGELASEYIAAVTDSGAVVTNSTANVTNSTALHPNLPLIPETLTDLSAVQNQLAQVSPAPLDLTLVEAQIKRELQHQVRGQEAATSTLAFRVARHLARDEPRRPLSVFMVGPTGVGKTRSAEVLAHALDNLEPRSASNRSQRYGFLRLDMSEYQEKHRLSQLLGSPQGYLGYGDGAQLTDALAANPRTVVLLDEIEKAHPDILRALMNALDAGRLSRAGGAPGSREIDCRQAIFLFTSNLNDGIKDDLRLWEALEDDSSESAYRRAVDESCRRRLLQSGIAPELTGRMGCFLAYRPLKTGARIEIVTLAIVCLAHEYGVQIARIAPEVVAYVVQHGPENEFGARPDEYFVDELFGDAFATARNAQNPGQKFQLNGPPFVCVPIEKEGQSA